MKLSEQHGAEHDAKGGEDVFQMQGAEKIGKDRILFSGFEIHDDESNQRNKDQRCVQIKDQT